MATKVSVVTEAAAAKVSVVGIQGPAGASSFDGMTDVNTSDKINESFIRWNSSTSKWESGNTIDELPGLAITSIANNDFLQYNGTAWVNVSDLTLANGITITGTLTDIDTTTVDIDALGIMQLDAATSIDIGVGSSAVPVGIGATVSETTVNDNFTVTGTTDFDGGVVINEAGTIGNDVRIESNLNAYMFFLDGGKDAVLFGSNTDTSSIDTPFLIDYLARTATATVNFDRFKVGGTNAITIPSGTTTLATAAHFAEPNFTATGTITSAVTVYIAAAPTEGGTNNYALWVDAGATKLDGTLHIDGLITATGGLTQSGAVDVNATTLALDGSSSMALGTASSGIAVSIGHTTSETTVNDNFNVTGDSKFTGLLNVDGAVDIDAITSFNIDSAVTMNFGVLNSGVAINIGHTTSETTVNDNLNVTGNAVITGTLNADGPIDIDAITSFNIDSAVTMNFGVLNSGVAINIGHTTSETTINDNLTVTGNLTINGATIGLGAGTSETTVNDNFTVTGTTDLDGGVIINEASADVDFRIESADNAYMAYLDGSKNALLFGSNTDTSSADTPFLIDYLARTATTTVNFARFKVGGTNAVTIPSGTTAIAAGAHFAEPNFTATGTITTAVNVYIAGAPSEGGTNNYALWVDAGLTKLDGNLTVDGTSALVITNITGLLTPSAGMTLSGAVDVNATTLAFDGSSSMSFGIASSGIAISIGHTTSEVTINDNLTVTGDLTVNGTTTTVNTTNLLVTDKLITLNDGGGSSSAAGSGIEFEESSSAAGYIKVGAADRGVFELKTPENAGVFTIDINATETLTIAGSLNVEADSNINQDVTTDATPTFAGITTTGTHSEVQTNGATINTKSAMSELTSVSGATVTASSLIPAGANVIGVTTRVTTGLGTGNGTSGYTIGDGVDVDVWGSISGTSSGTTSTHADYTTNTALGLFTSANNIVLTAVGGNFNGTGAIRIVVFYQDVTAPTG